MPGSRSSVSASPGCQYEEICRIAGPLMPRWVTSRKLLKLSWLQLAVTGNATPLRSARRSWCLPLSVSGTRPARVGNTAWPNWRASSKP